MTAITISTSPSFTVIATDEAGERHDLNARGGRIADLDGLREFIAELLDQGVISASDAESLALQIEAL
jgi:hypothetical protein